MQNPKHLTNTPAASQLIAWHTVLDVAAYSVHMVGDVLMVNGKRVAHEHPVQFVIALSGMKISAARRWLATHEWNKPVSKPEYAHGLDAETARRCAEHPAPDNT